MVRSTTDSVAAQPCGALACVPAIRGSGATGEARTPDRRFRKPMLYPAELLSHNDILLSREPRSDKTD